MRRLLFVILAGSLVACGSAPRAAEPTGVSPAPLAVRPSPAPADPARVAALQALVARVARPDGGGYVILDDVTDERRDGRIRQLQLSLDADAVVPCDSVFLPCSVVQPRLVPLGFRPDVVYPNQALVRDVRGMSAPALAQLCEQVFLVGLGASPGYRLEWTGAIQRSPAPLTTPRGGQG
ncbi:MAG TPA: hypothetical protein VFD49_15360 [Candidatus Dormibacteraeota bacterium]|nr:hypothetical protein [Candidatus Dormibacteraeota bacterium]